MRRHSNPVIQGGLLGLLLLACTTADGKRARTKKGPAMNDDQAIAALSSHTTWCAGAAALARSGARRAIAPLVRAYETPIEGADKGCLLKALKELAPHDVVVELATAAEAEERRVAMKVMELYPDAAWLGPVERALGDAEAKVQRQALRALVAQYQTPAWEALLVKLLDSTSAAARAQARESLGRRDTASAKRALVEHPAR